MQTINNYAKNQKLCKQCLFFNGVYAPVKLTNKYFLNKIKNQHQSPIMQATLPVQSMKLVLTSFVVFRTIFLSGQKQMFASHLLPFWNGQILLLDHKGRQKIVDFTIYNTFFFQYLL